MITLLGDNPIHVSIGAIFVDPGITLVDDTDSAPTYVTFVDGIQQETSEMDTSSQTTHIITYSATDAKWNGATATRAVIIGDSLTPSTLPLTPSDGDTPPPVVSDVEPPVVTLVGDAALQITVGNTFTDPGATATDLTSSIVVTGAVDTATAGLYSLTYTATDAAGNVASVSRVVTVIVDAPASVVAIDASATSTAATTDSTSSPQATP